MEGKLKNILQKKFSQYSTEKLQYLEISFLILVSRARNGKKLFQAILFYFILFYFILFYFILFYFILFHFILFYFILFYFILFYFIVTGIQQGICLLDINALSTFSSVTKIIIKF